MQNGPLVTAEWLKKNGHSKGVKIFDASYHLPATGRNARAEYEARHIEAAKFFDIDEIADRSNALPHSLPSRAVIENAMSALGTGRDDTQIFYDNSDLHSAARGWWMLKAHGYPNVHILDGGLNAWERKGGRIATGISDTLMLDPTPTGPPTDATHFASIKEVRKMNEKQSHQIIDARTRGRFEGTAPEPKPGLPSGHMENTLNLPYQDLFDAEGYYKPPADLRPLFTALGVDGTTPVVTTCGSGITACTIMVALAVIGIHDVKVYDGSWVEWASQPDANNFIRKNQA